MSDNFENNTNGFDSENDVYSADKPETNTDSQNDDGFSTAQPQSDSNESVYSGEVYGNQTADNGYYNQPQSTENQNPYGYQNPADTSYGYQNQPPQYQPDAQNGQYGYYSNQNPTEPVQPYNFQNTNGSFVPPQPGGPNGPKKKSSKGKLIAAVVIVLVVAIGVVFAITALRPSTKNPSGEQTTISSQEGVVDNGTTAAAGNNQLQYSTTDSSNLEALSAVDVAEKARPSVVGVMTYQGGQLSGEGSGVVMGVDSTGKYTYVITCAHVINEDGATYGVSTLDGKKYEAEMVATDSRTDIGVLKVEATDLPVAEFGDSSTLKVGETVYAIGNPGGSDYFGSMTNGIISAIDRSVSGTYTMTCIQHNAAINPGNSGGALVNSAGQVIGINSSKIAATDYEG
ncbi:MAG: S1C family serine protease, partial [Acutalibacteraceae bacterium]